MDTRNTSVQGGHPPFLAGGGRMGAAVRAFDWGATPLGDPTGWPPSLRTVLRTVLNSGQPMCFWWGPDLRQFHNDAYLPMLGERADDALGAPFQVFWSEVWEDVRPYAEDALAGRGTWMENLPLRMTRHGETKDTFWTFSYSPLYGDDDTVRGILNIVTETTRAVRNGQALADEVGRTKAAIEAQREAEERQRVLQGELSHRMKNTLSMVQAVVSQSLRHANDTATAAAMAAERIQALGRAQDILTATDWGSSDVAEIVGAAVAPHDDKRDRIVLDGPPASVHAQQAMGLALAMHELATNATKYGALSNDTGSVTISWNVSETNDFRLTWLEKGGPPVVEPMRHGFGSRLIQRVVPSYFAGGAVLEYAPSGFIYVLEGSLAAGRPD